MSNYYDRRKKTNNKNMRMDAIATYICFIIFLLVMSIFVN